MKSSFLRVRNTKNNAIMEKIIDVVMFASAQYHRNTTTLKLSIKNFVKATSKLVSAKSKASTPNPKSDRNMPPIKKRKLFTNPQEMAIGSQKMQVESKKNKIRKVVMTALRVQ